MNDGSTSIGKCAQVAGEFHKTQAKLRAVFDAIHEAICVVDLDYNLTDLNQAMCDAFGLGEKEAILGRKCFEVFKGRKDRCPHCIVAQAYRTKSPTYRVSTPDDVELTSGRVYEMFAYPIVDDGGNVEGAVEFARDITDRKQAERQLQEAHDQLEQQVHDRTAELARANEQLKQEFRQRREAEQALVRAQRLASIGTLATGIAHEINNPLGAILLSAETAAACQQQPDKQDVVKRQLDNIRDAAIRGGRIVKSVLQFAREETTRKWPNDMGLILRRCRDFTRRLADEKKVAVRLELGPEPVQAVVNPIEIEQVLINLISNALDASPPQTAVTVRLQEEAATVRIQIEDRGLGMTEEVRDRIFDPFFSTHHDQGGTGLGLSLAHGIVRQHGGTIEVRTAPDQGTTMTITLPTESPYSFVI